MGKFNIIQFGLYLALSAAILGLLCGLLYPFIGAFYGNSITWCWPSSEGISGFCPFLIYLLKGIWALIWYLLQWLWAIIWVSWVFAFFGFVIGIVLGVVIKPFAGFFGPSS